MDTQQEMAMTAMRQYVSDMVALESHIEEALDGQLREVRDHPQAAAALERFHSTVRNQREALRVHFQRIGGDASGPLKTAVAAAFGMAAGAINRVRSQGTSKALRDDYTAFNHAAAGYAMLLTTAELLGFQETAELAAQHLQAYDQAVEEIAGLLPEVVAWELRRDGHLVDERASGRAAQTLVRIWRGKDIGAGDGAGVAPSGGDGTRAA
ncbi:MAG TPA: DUF892 family protein [Chloroflexota bacterium]|jgi:ferritin-like metal-binding protein YciE|nr:DUF892 family protein [Chloroflexota bacterium]